MPAPPLTNTFESGQADTTVITVGNSGGGAGDAFSAVSSPSAPTFSTTHAKSGTLAMKFDTTATYTENHVAWTGLGSILTSVWVRGYYYFTGLPVTQSLKLLTARTSANANSGFIYFQTSGTIRAALASQVGVGTNGAVAVALNQWVRIEARFVSSTTVGEIEWWLYNTPDAAVGDFDEHVNTTGLVLGANTDGMRYGPSTAIGPNSFVGWIDDVAVSSVGQIGPSLITDTGLAWLRA